MRKFLALALAAALLTGLAACSDDDSAKASASPSGATKAYCGELKQLGDAFGDPGVDELFKEHPDPTLAEWAAFLPKPIAKIRGMADDVEALDEPDDLPTAISASVHRAVALLREGGDTYEHSMEAAAAGDQATFDADGEKVQTEIGPAIGKAFAKAGAACGFEDSSKQG